jgi:hypothetical protein
MSLHGIYIRWNDLVKIEYSFVVRDGEEERL